MASQNGTEAAAELPEPEDIQFELTDEAFEELADLEGKSVIGVSFWDSSLADELEEEPPDSENRVALDIDFFLEDHALLEVYGAALFSSTDGDQLLVGMTALEAGLVTLVDHEAVLSEVAETEDGNPVFVFAVGDAIVLVVAAGAWAIDAWEELPEVD